DLLAGKDTVWPLYIDPSYSAGGWGQNWTYVSSAFPSQSYWRTSDSTGLRVGYNGWESPYYVGRAFAQMSVAPELAGAQISSSTFYATETWSPSCSGRNVELWWTGSIGSGTTWNNQPGLISRLDTKNEAHGYSSSCPAQSVGFTMTGAMQSAVASGKSDITLGLRAGDEGDSYGWKKFQPSSMSISTTYNHAPTAPGSLSTSPATVCGANPPSVIGNGDVVLYAGVNDQDGGSLGVAFTLKKSDGTVVASSSTGSLAATAGTTSAFVIPRATLAAAANGAQTTFNWNVYTSDGSATSPVSSTCQFTFDPTVPGAPTITQAANPSYTVGTAATFTFTANATGSAPASFLYQLNGASPVSVAAVSGSANAAIKPSRAVNTLSVTAVSAGGNIGDTAVLVVNATAPAAAAENDLTGTGRADLALVGNQAGLPSGLWLSSGATADSVNTAVNNIGIQGTGANTPGAAADWNGSQAIVGHFRSGGGFNDVLQYNPANGTGHILYGAGDGSALTPNSGSQVNVNAVAFTSGQGGAKATQVANAGALYEIVHEDPVGIPGLLMVFNGQLALTNGVGTPGAYPAADASVALTSTNPAGGADWTGWTITTALVNNLPALYARNTTTGELWYYSPTVLANLAAVPLQGTNPTPNTPVKLAASGWTSAAKPVLQAADINRDGTADLWSVDGTGKVTANVFNGTAFSTLPSQLLVAPTHSWALSEGGTEGSRATSAGDSAGALPLSGDTGATWSGKDLFNPDVHLNGTGAGVLSTTTPAATLSADFSASVWVKPNAVDGVVLSQDGTSSAGFIVYADANSKQWYFCMSKADSSAWTYDCVHAGVGGGMAQIGVWTHLTVTYHASTKVMALYINGIEVGYGSHDPVAGFTGGFRVGDYMYSGGHRTFFNGAVSNVQTWAGTTLTPNQVALLSGTPGYVLFPSDDTNYSTGSSWSTSRATMTFNSGLLTITKANGSTWSVGSSGYPNAALTLQRDGNFGIYQQQAHQAGTGVWAAMVVSAGDCMFLQPDGNLVIYSSDGVPIWASGTNN
ncbi:hypothetical protein AB0K51_34015, partial [Kitasatospora sp. NPDC049285]|uniref:hypothetical protein n=1 Tax=Kitasatospora sp. NPDC049285 TaxID=3157096 RepID=UPI0034218965